MALTTEQKASFLFKQSQGVAETSLLRDFYEESIKGRILVLNNQIWSASDQIPATAPSLADGATSGVVKYFQARSMTAVAGVNNSFYLEDLKDSIPFNFGDGSYNYVITSSTGTAIPFGQGDWLVNNTTGTLTFYGSVPANMPPKISFYKYVGVKGAGGEAALPAVYVVATIAERDALSPKQGDLCIVTSENQTYAWSATSWVLIQSAGAVSSVNTKTGAVTLTASDVGAIDVTQKGAANGVATLDATGKVPSGQLPAVNAPVTSVNTKIGDVVLSTTDIGEGTNKYFTDLRAKTAAVINSTSGSETDQAASVSAMKTYVANNAAVTSVNTKTGAVSLITGDIPETPYSAESFSAGANTLSTVMSNGGVGTKTAALSIGGQASFSGTSRISSCYKYDGSTWSATASYNRPMSEMCSTGVQNAALSAGGGDNGMQYSPFVGYTSYRDVYGFNGSTWSTKSSLPGTTGRVNGMIAGTDNAAVQFGGMYFFASGGSGQYYETNTTYLYNGTTWSTGNNLLTNLSGCRGLGTQSNALCIANTVSCKFNGTSWSALGVNTIVSRYSAQAFGSVTDAFYVGGSGASAQYPEYWNGSTFTLKSNLTTGSAVVNSGANTTATSSSSSGMMWNGYNSISSSVTNATYVYNPEVSYLYLNNQRVLNTFSSNSLPYTLNLAPTGLSSGNTGTIKLYELLANGSNSVGFKAPDGLASDVMWTLPSADGTSGFVLSTNGAGTLSWISSAGTQSVSGVDYYSLESTSFNGKIVFSNIEQTMLYDVWTSAQTINAIKSTGGCAGTQNSAVIFGGSSNGAYGSFTASNTSEYFNSYSWSTGANINTARYQMTGCGIFSAALSFGGSTGTVSAVSEKFNGSAWTATGSLNTARSYLGGSGIQNAALSFGGTTGAVSAVTERFNGSTWAASTALTSAKYGLAGAGTQNATIATGGFTTVAVLTSDIYNGSVWIVASTLPNSRYYLSCAGTQNSALAFGDYPGGYSQYTSKYNGSTWYGSINSNAGISNAQSTGTQNSAIAAGGYTYSNGGNYASRATQLYFGNLPLGIQGIYKGSSKHLIFESLQNSLTMNLGAESGLTHINTIFDENTGIKNQERAWIAELQKETQQPGFFAVSAYMNEARYRLGGCGSKNSSLSVGGYTSGTTASYTAEKFNGVSWATTGYLNGSSAGAACGIQNAALFIKETSGSLENFNGSTWSSLITGSPSYIYYPVAVGCMNACFAIGNAASFKFNGVYAVSTYNSSVYSTYNATGSMNAALVFGSSPSHIYNGFTFKACQPVISVFSHAGTAGSQNRTQAFGGSSSPTSTASAISTGTIFNGDSWSISENLNSNRTMCGSGGMQKSACVFGGSDGTNSVSSTEILNYTLDFIPRNSGPSSGNWSSSGNMVTAGNYDMAGCGEQNAALSFGGYNYTTSTARIVTEKFNGTTWSTTGNLATLRYGNRGAGFQNAAVTFGGYNTAILNSTELFNGTSWSSSGNMATGKFAGGGVGRRNAALSWAGTTAPDSATTISANEVFNGSTWSTMNAWQISSGSPYAAYFGACGRQNAALAAGGYSPSTTSITTAYVFNGFVWYYATSSLTSSRAPAIGAGSQNAAMIFGYWSTYEIFNGYTFTSAGYTNSSFNKGAGAGSCYATLGFGTFSTSATSTPTDKYIENTPTAFQYG